MQQLPAFLSVAPVEPEKESIEASRFRMGQYDKEVKEKLGEEVVKMILDAVENAEITKQKMEDIAQGFGPKVRGGHVSRNDACDSAEMRKILSDWYQHELYDMGGEEGVQKLVKLFESEEISLKPLASQLRRYLNKRSEEDKETIQMKVYEKLGENVIEMINNAVKNGAITKDKLEGIAKGLGPYVEKKHKERGQCDDLEIERILGDWFRKDLLDMNGERALNVLVKIFEKDEINLKDLATKLKGINTGIFKREDVVIVDSLKNSQNVFKTLLLIGKTGSGKSSLCNRLSGHEAKSDIFPQSSGAAPCTRETTFGIVKLGGKSEHYVSLIDTVGFDDPSNDTDVLTIAELVTKLRNGCDFIDTFGITINSQHRRVEGSLVAMLRVFEGMFGENFWKQAVLLLTHCQMDEKTKGRRRENTGKTDHELAQEYIENLREWFPKCEGLKYVFIDAGHFDQALKDIWDMLEEGQRLPTSAVNENVQSQPLNLTKALKEAEDKFKTDAEIRLKQHEQRWRQAFYNNQQVLEMEREKNRHLKEREKQTKRLADKNSKEMRDVKKTLQEMQKSKQESAEGKAPGTGEKEMEMTNSYEILIAKHIGDEDKVVVSQSFCGGTLSAIFAKCQQHEKPAVYWGVSKSHEDFMSRFGKLGGNQKQIYSLACNDSLGFGVFAMTGFGSCQQVVPDMDEVYPGTRKNKLNVRYNTVKATEEGKQGYRITTVGARHEHFYFVLTKDVEGFSARKQSYFTSAEWNTVSKMIEVEWKDGKIVTSICFCEKKKRYLVVMTESDAGQETRWDKGNRKDENWTNDKERGGFHPTVIFKDPTSGRVWRVVTTEKDKNRISTNVITDVLCNT